MNIFAISLAIFVGLMFIFSYKLSSEYRSSKDGYLLGNRNVSTLELSSSFAASWMYVFGLIMVGTFTYNGGLAGLFWFLLPQVLALLVVLKVSLQLLDVVPNGYTASDFLKEKFKGSLLSRVFQIAMILAIANAIVGNLTGFGLIAEYVGQGQISYPVIVSVTGLTILAYTLWGGLKSSLRTDVLQVGLILLCGLLGAGFAAYGVGGVSNLISGIVAAKPAGILETPLMMAMGLPLLIIMTGATLNDNGIYQRVLASGNKKQVVRSSLIAIVMVVVAFGCLGIIAGSLHSLGINPSNPKLAGTIGIEQALGGFGLFLMSLAALAASASTIDTALNSFGSMMANDFFPEKDPINTSRISMVLLMAAGLVVALMKIDIWLIFMFFGVARLVTIVPFIYGAFSKTQLKNTWPLLSSIVGSFALGMASKLQYVKMAPFTESVVLATIPILGLLASIVLSKQK